MPDHRNLIDHKTEVIDDPPRYCKHCGGETKVRYYSKGKARGRGKQWRCNACIRVAAAKRRRRLGIQKRESSTKYRPPISMRWPTLAKIIRDSVGLQYITGKLTPPNDIH